MKHTVDSQTPTASEHRPRCRSRTEGTQLGTHERLPRSTACFCRRRTRDKTSQNLEVREERSRRCCVLLLPMTLVASSCSSTNCSGDRSSPFGSMTSGSPFWFVRAGVPLCLDNTWPPFFAALLLSVFFLPSMFCLECGLEKPVQSFAQEMLVHQSGYLQCLKCVNRGASKPTWVSRQRPCVSCGMLQNNTMFSHNQLKSTSGSKCVYCMGRATCGKCLRQMSLLEFSDQQLPRGQHRRCRPCSVE